LWFLWACTPAASEPRATTASKPVVTGRGPPLVLATAAVETPAVASSDAAQVASFGHVTRFTAHAPWPAEPPVAPRTAEHGPLYERFHEKRRANVGSGYLSLLDVAADESFLVVASTQEARVRAYAYGSLALLGVATVDGFSEFGAAALAAWPSEVAAPLAVFGGPGGLVLLNIRAGTTSPLAAEPADSLRWSNDRRVLGATSSRIPEQRSTLVFYRPSLERPGLEALLSMDFSERVDEWALDGEKRRLAVLLYPSDTLELLDLDTHAVVFVVPVPAYAETVDFSPDGRRIAVGGASVAVYDSGTGRILAEDRHFGNNIDTVRFSPGGDALAVSSYEGKLRVFDVTGPGPGLPLRKLLRHSGTANVYEVAWTREGRELVSTSGDRTVRIWGE
jgi:DNA-binding beta-propeller fold protein YncE